jgi:tRNA threonylcarbamoyl adenosine modification protein (Sua5/YciO/YrdC/YwlC family)
MASLEQPRSASTSELDAAARELAGGKLVVVPTDTVYGIAALPDAPGAVDALFEVKDRSRDKPIPILGPDASVLQKVARFDRRELAVAQRFWPGPLTLVLERVGGFDIDLGSRSERTVAVRVPDCAALIDLMALTGPLAVTSANLSGRPPAATVEEARAMLGASVTVYLAGASGGGLASTIVSAIGAPEVIRPGPIDGRAVVQMLTS